MSYISHSGYGYSKKLCEDVTSWFVNTYYPRHKLDIDIVHRGLKCDKVVGLCDVNGQSRTHGGDLMDHSHHTILQPYHTSIHGEQCQYQVCVVDNSCSQTKR